MMDSMGITTLNGLVVAAEVNYTSKSANNHDTCEHTSNTQLESRLWPFGRHCSIAANPLSKTYHGAAFYFLYS